MIWSQMVRSDPLHTLQEEQCHQLPMELLHNQQHNFVSNYLLSKTTYLTFL